MACLRLGLLQRAFRSIFQNSFVVIDSRNVGAAPRAVRLSDSYLDARNGWIVASVIAGIVLAGFVAAGVARERSLARHGVKTEGRVVARHVEGGKTNSSHVEVTFDAAKTSMRRDFVVSDATYEADEIGTPFPVFYDATDPTNATIDPITESDAFEYGVKWWLAWGAGGIVVASIFLGVAGTAKKQGQRLAEWTLAELVVERVTTTSSKDSNLTVSGTYRDVKGNRISVNAVSVSKTVHVERPIPILADPCSDEVVALESITYVEIDSAGHS